MENIRPVFKKLLAAAIVVYVIGTALILSDLCEKVGTLEFAMMHVTGTCTARHK